MDGENSEMVLGLINFTDYGTRNAVGLKLQNGVMLVIFHRDDIG